jgi:F-type H+-transporting ATPase subunit b
MSEAQPQDPGQPAEHPDAVATVEHGAAAGEHAQPSFYGITAPMFISLAMLVVVGIMLWKKVHHAIARALDDKIALIRDQLAEAEALRKEAEALKAEYEKKAKGVEKDRKALLERAKHEADEIVAKAQADAEALIARRSRMAEDKIAAEERAAVDQLRAAVAEAAAKAAARLIAERHDPKSDELLVDRAISEIAGR